MGFGSALGALGRGFSAAIRELSPAQRFLTAAVLPLAAAPIAFASASGGGPSPQEAATEQLQQQLEASGYDPEQAALIAQQQVALQGQGQPQQGTPQGAQGAQGGQEEAALPEITDDMLGQNLYDMDLSPTGAAAGPDVTASDGQETSYQQRVLAGLQIDQDPSSDMSTAIQQQVRGMIQG